MYADKITDSMQKTIDETNYRRNKQMAYNQEHNMTPKALNKKISNDLIKNSYEEIQMIQLQKVAETEIKYKSKTQIEKIIREKRKEMEIAAKDLDFINAARLRDEIKVLKEKLSE
jgi:excinuclease ABC subunit B